MKCKAPIKFNENWNKKIYNEDFPVEKYLIPHLGQRKLLITELEFLLYCFKNYKPELIVYAGAGPGVHIPFLIDLLYFTKFKMASNVV